MRELNNCAWEMLHSKPYRGYLHYGRQNVIVRRASRAVLTSLNSMRSLSKKIFSSDFRILYKCVNRRGVTVLQSGRPLQPKFTKAQRQGISKNFFKTVTKSFPVNVSQMFVRFKSFCRKYLLTSLFSRVKIMEHNELQFAIPAKKIITFIVPMSGRTRVLNNYTRQLLKVLTEPVF